MISGAAVTAAELATTMERLATVTEGPFGVNFIVPMIDREALELAIPTAPLIEFFYGQPLGTLVELAHEGGALVSWQVGSVREAREAADVGCDLIVAQAVEAGGHVRGEVALLPLLDGVLAAVDTPVLAAGGIATGRSLAAVLAAGADGARIGTRFLATPEAGAHSSYVDALMRAEADDTVLTEAFSVMWPDAPHRVLKSCVDAARDFRGKTVATMKLETRSVELPPFHVHAPNKDTTGAVEAMALYGGQSVGAIGDVQPAGTIVRDLA